MINSIPLIHSRNNSITLSTSEVYYEENVTTNVPSTENTTAEQ